MKYAIAYDTSRYAGGYALVGSIEDGSPEYPESADTYETKAEAQAAADKLNAENELSPYYVWEIEDDTEKLIEHLENSYGYKILTATAGTNGNGGMTSEVDDLLESDLSGFKTAHVDAEDLASHWYDAHGEPFPETENATDWIAFDHAHQDSAGYLTGLVSRIYICTAI